MIKEYEDLKKILKTSEGKELYAHLMDCFNTLVMYYPEDVLDKFEEVSYLLKDDDKNKISKFLNIENKIDHKVKTACQSGFVSKVESLLVKKQEDGDEPVEAPTAGKVSNLFADFEVFEWAGVSFGSDELFRLQQSLARLSISSGSERLRFWGKVYGTQKDYYIAEGFVQATDEDGTEKPKGFEERGVGTNQFVYWVTDNPLNNWTMLPDITPDMLKASRAIKVMFTGNLEHQIITNPFFFGLEKHYLRAQIARISHSTSIMPRGLHKITEDNLMEIEPIEFEDESKKYIPTSATQSHLSNWVHASKSILKCNRVSHMEPDPEEFEGIEPEEVTKILNTRDPAEPRLKQLTEDISALENEPAWTLRIVGDQVGVASINVIRSQIWPGSVTCWKQSRQLQIYVGDGLKRERIEPSAMANTDREVDYVKTYYPVDIPFIQEEPTDFLGYPEPNDRIYIYERDCDLSMDKEQYEEYIREEYERKEKLRQEKKLKASNLS